MQPQAPHCWPWKYCSHNPHTAGQGSIALWPVCRKLCSQVMGQQQVTDDVLDMKLQVRTVRYTFEYLAVAATCSLLGGASSRLPCSCHIGFRLFIAYSPILMIHACLSCFPGKNFLLRASYATVCYVMWTPDAWRTGSCGFCQEAGISNLIPHLPVFMFGKPLEASETQMLSTRSCRCRYNL